MTVERCFACGRKLGKNPKRVDTHEDQQPFVGSDCYVLIARAGSEGYQPMRNGKPSGPRLWLLSEEKRK